MGKFYAVLYGQRGAKEFRKLKPAEKFAKQKATIRRERTEIDVIHTYPRAKAGETDWSQSHLKYVRPGSKAEAEKIRKRQRAARNRDSNPWAIRW